jgi:mRNA interferase MazF
MPRTPNPGDILKMKLPAEEGGTEEQRVMVLSERRFNVATGRAVCCPIAANATGSPFEVPIPAGLQTKGYVVACEVRTVDFLARKALLVEKAPPDLHHEVQAITCAIVGCT